MQLTYLFTSRIYLKTILCGLFVVLVFGCENGVDNDKEEEPKNYKEYGKVITDGLIAYYPFDGDAEDYSGNELHGIENGIETTTGRFDQEEGALKFDGIDDYIEIPQFSEINNMSGTICFWARIPSGIHIDTLVAVISRRDTVGEGYIISLHGSKDYWYDFKTVYGTESGEYMRSNYWEDQKYLFIGVTFSKGIDTTSTVFTYYFQGYPTIEAKHRFPGRNFSFNNSSMPLFIGKSLIQKYNYFRGEIDDLLIFDRALSGEEILELFNWE